MGWLAWYRDRRDELAVKKGRIMTKHLRNLGVYNKAAAAFLGGLASVGLLLTPVADEFPGGAAALVGVTGTLTAVAVAMTRNQELIDRAGDTAADLIER